MTGPYRVAPPSLEADPFPHVDERVPFIRTGSWRHGNISAEWEEESGRITLIVSGKAANGSDTYIRTAMCIDDAEMILGALRRTIVLARKRAPQEVGG